MLTIWAAFWVLLRILVFSTVSPHLLRWPYGSGWYSRALLKALEHEPRSSWHLKTTGYCVCERRDTWHADPSTWRGGEIAWHPGINSGRLPLAWLH